MIDKKIINGFVYGSPLCNYRSVYKRKCMIDFLYIGMCVSVFIKERKKERTSMYLYANVCFLISIYNVNSTFIRM